MPTRAAGEFGTWRVEGKSPVVQYSLLLMEEIRALAVEGYRSLPRTGMEVGGVLFGYREGNLVNVVAQRPLECEHAMGPAFLLSKRDEAGLTTLIVESRRDPALAGARPVGWYHSHTRSDVLLSDEDLEIFDRHFPERWQVALVLRPQKFGPCQAGFFIREQDGSVRAEASYREFTLEALEPAAAKPPAARASVETAADPPEFERAAGASASAQDGSGWKWAFIALLVVIIGAAAGFAGKTYVGPGAPPAAVALRALDINGQLVIAWDRLSGAVEKAETGALEIKDGAGVITIPLDRDHLAAGQATYLRESGTVEVHMATYAGGRTLAREAVSFAGPPPANTLKAAELVRQREQAIRERDQAAKEADDLRGELRAAGQKRNELEGAIRALERRLAVEASLRRK
jgi:proteasome lid subunit RPN8/RPN11